MMCEAVCLESRPAGLRSLPTLSSRRHMSEADGECGGLVERPGEVGAGEEEEETGELAEL